MPFLGQTPGSKLNTNVMLDAITTSATATYALEKGSAAYTPKSVQALLVSLNGVTQAPAAAYTISGSNIVFSSALTSNDVIDYIIAFEGDVTSLDVSNISAGDIATSMLANSSVTTAKMAASSTVCPPHNFHFDRVSAHPFTSSLKCACTSWQYLCHSSQYS